MAERTADRAGSRVCYENSCEWKRSAEHAAVSSLLESKALVRHFGYAAVAVSPMTQRVEQRHADDRHPQPGRGVAHALAEEELGVVLRIDVDVVGSVGVEAALGERALATTVFPDSGAVAPMTGLV